MASATRVVALASEHRKSIPENRWNVFDADQISEEEIMKRYMVFPGLPSEIHACRRSGGGVLHEAAGHMREMLL